MITGANGFVGRSLRQTLLEAGFTVRSAVRGLADRPRTNEDECIVGDVGPRTDWTRALNEIDVVVHLAARAHMLRDPTGAEAYIQTNAEGTRRLGEAALKAGVRKFIFLSSIKVNGEHSGKLPFCPTDPPNPKDIYSLSKLQGEQHLQALAAGTRMDLAIVRAPLIYGPGVKANFLRLLRMVERVRIMPFGSIQNSRSLVSTWNLCDLIRHLASARFPPGRVWMVSDGEDLSTTELVRRLATAMDRQIWMARVPVSWLRRAAAIIERKAELERLVGSLAIDVSNTTRDLSWNPPLSMNEGLRRTVVWYLTEGRRSAS